MSSTKRKADEAFKSTDRAHLRPNGPDKSQPNAPNTATSGNLHRQSRLRDKAGALLKTRQQLPIWPHANEIRRKVRENDVVMLVGETGSGKSTQIPQFLVDEEWCCARRATGKPNQASSRAKGGQKGGGVVGGRIAILQPRRVAAISLATRVAQEVGTSLGASSPVSSVGYSVRFDNNVGPATRIKFLTDGMLLQELLRDPWLKEYSCVIVDEVHERGVNVDLVLGFLRRILEVGKSAGVQEDGRGGVPLKVVVMSATADMEGIQGFFSALQVGGLEERTVKGAEQAGSTSNGDQQDGNEWGGFSDDEAQNDHNHSEQPQNRNITVTSCYIEGRQYPVTIHYTSMPTTNLLDTAMDRIVQLHQHTPLPGDVLVFLSGQEMIENLESLCNTYASSIADPSKPLPSSSQKKDQQKLPGLQILPLFASLPTHLQARIFQPTPPFTRRIILSTNIAETSITVPGIRHVIDTGKHKSRLFRPGLNLDTLLSSSISQSMAKQRSGRAGREAPGHSYRLYTEKDYWNLEKDTKPEILSTDLSFLVLTLKAHGVDDVLGFPLLTKPPRQSLEAALEGLLNLNALDAETGSITAIGRKMAGLPVRPDLARILLEGTNHNEKVLDGVVDIVSALSLEEGIFLPIHNNNNKSIQQKRSTPNGGSKKTKEQLLLGNGHTSTTKNDDNEDEDEPTNPIETARRTLLSRHSDHLTLLTAIQTYTSPLTHDRRAWCDALAISHRAMSRITDVRKQLRQLMAQTRFSLRERSGPAQAHSASSTSSAALDNLIDASTILRCLCTGLWTNIAIQTALAPNAAHVPGENPNQRAPYTTLLTGQGVHIHPSSVLFTQRDGGGGKEDEAGRKGGARGKGGRKGAGMAVSGMPKVIVFTDLVYTSKPYARNVSAVELSWVTEMGMLS